MTIASPVNSTSYVGNGASSVYGFSFPVFSAGDLVVTVTDPSKNVSSLSLTQDYTVSGLNSAGGGPSSGSITLANNSQAWLSSGNLANGWTITLTRVVSLVQSTSIRNQANYFPSVLENALDYLTMALQQIQAVQDVSPAGTPPNVFAGVDVIVETPGDGLVVTTPDGSKTYRIAVSNAGALYAQRLT